MLVSNLGNREYYHVYPVSSQTKDFQFGNCCCFPSHSSLLRKSIDWFVCMRWSERHLTVSVCWHYQFHECWYSTNQVSLFLSNEIVTCFCHDIEKFEDSKRVIRTRKSKKNRQHNGRKKKYKKTNNDLQNIHIKLKIE